jgi:hypothetical protein
VLTKALNGEFLMKPIVPLRVTMVAQIPQYCNAPEISKHSKKIRDLESFFWKRNERSSKHGGSG